jgi:HK97 family phage prohead protease
MQDIQFKAASGQFNIDEAQGIVECFVAGIGNKDSVGDIVVSGAFAKSLMRRKPRVVWGHNWNDPIGKVLEIYEVPANDPRLPAKMKAAGIGGLYAKVQFNLNSEKGKEAFTNVAFFGEEQEWSIGYKTLDAIYDNSKQANILREVELYELSPVLHGANQLTGTISVKSEEKGHGMSPMGVIMLEEKPKQPQDPFLQGVAQPLEGDRLVALQNELASRTGGPVKVMKATESSVTFLKPGKGMFRLGYYFDGEQYMFGKPEKIGMPMMINKPMPPMQRPGAGPKPMPRIPNFPGVTQKPYSAQEPAVPVKYGDSDIQSGLFDSSKSENDEFVGKLKGIISSLQEIVGDDTEEKSAWVIPCSIENAFETKQALDPVFDYHRIETFVTEEGIVIASPLDYEAYEAVETATKGLAGRIGRGLTPGGGGKVRRGRAALARIEGVLDPRKRRDVDGDGMIFDGTWMEQPDPTRFAEPERGALSPRRGRGLASSTDDERLYIPTEKPETPKKEKRKATDEQKKNKRRAGGGTPWYIIEKQKNNRDIVPFIIPRYFKPRLDRMIDDFLDTDEGKALPEDHILRRVGKAIKTAKRYQELQPEINEFGQETGFTRPKQTSDFLPDIDEKMLKELQDVWPQISDGLAKTGGHRTNEKGNQEKGQTAFDALSSLIKNGSWSRVNKQTSGYMSEEQGRQADEAFDDSSILAGVVRRGERVRKARNEADKRGQRFQRGVDTRAGQRRADTGKKRVIKKVWPGDFQHAPFEFPTIKGEQTISYEKVIDGKKVDLLKPYIDAGLFPENWKTMSTEEKFAWFNENQKKLESIKETRTSPRWRNTIAKLNDFLLEETMKEDEKRERALRLTELRDKPKPAAEAPKAPAPKAPEKPKPQKPASAPTDGPDRVTSQTKKKIRAWADTIAEAVNSSGVDGDFADTAYDGAERVFSIAFPDDSTPLTRELVDDAQEELDNVIAELGSIAKERKLTKREKSTLQFMFQARKFLDEPFGDRENTEAELRGDEAGEALARRGRQVSRLGLDDDDEEVLGGADLGDIYDNDERNPGDWDDNDGGGLSSSTVNNIVGLRSSTRKARSFQSANQRKREGRSGLASSSKSPRTEITKESTWWKRVDESLPKEIRSADSEAIKQGLTILQQKISKYEAGSFRPNSKRTNVGSIKITADEADKILDAVMSVIDRQKTAGRDGGVGSRGEIFAELLEAVASSAMSTFVDKTSKPADD